MDQDRYDYNEARTTTTTSRQTGPLTFHPEYARSRAGILKIVEIVLSLITFICSISMYWNGHGWAEFVSITAFLSTLIYLIFHLLNLISRVPGPWLLIEFIYYIVFSVFFLITAILAAARAGIYDANVGATAFFAFAATAVYIVDTVFQFRAWHGGEATIATRTTTTTTTTTGSPIGSEPSRMQY